MRQLSRARRKFWDQPFFLTTLLAHVDDPSVALPPPPAKDEDDDDDEDDGSLDEHLAFDVLLSCAAPSSASLEDGASSSSSPVSRASSDFLRSKFGLKEGGLPGPARIGKRGVEICVGEQEHLAGSSEIGLVVFELDHDALDDE